MKKFTGKNGTPPVFYEKLSEALGKSWNSLGSINCEITQIEEQHYAVMFSPALREIYGGADDGENVFAGFNFNIGRFVQLFDKKPRPKVEFESLQRNSIPHLMFKGNVDGTELEIFIMERPVNTQKAVERLYTNGPKKGEVEAI